MAKKKAEEEKKAEEKKEEAEEKKAEKKAEAKVKEAELDIKSKAKKKEVKAKEKEAEPEALAKVPAKTVLLKKSPKEVEDLIVKLAQKGTAIASIGLILRDTYGIPSIKKLTGQKISKILEKHNLKTLSGLDDLVKKADELIKHLQKNKQDQVAKRGLLITEAKISKLSMYYKKKGALPESWKHK